MKKRFITISLICLGFVAKAQTSYQQGMETAFSLWEANQIVAATNAFERIAMASPEAWIPSYYAAQIIIVNAFTIQDKPVLTQQLDKAQAHIDNAAKCAPDNPEIIVLQAMLYTVWVAYDGASYGMKYAPKISQLYTEAYALDQNNPRVILCKAEWDIGSARYFGQDTAVFCKELRGLPNCLKTSWLKRILSPVGGRNAQKNCQTNVQTKAAV